MLSITGTILPPTAEDFCALMRSFVGSPAYHQILSSPHLTGKVGPISERDFYLALRYFPRRFTAIHERLLTQLCAVFVRCEQILQKRKSFLPSSLVKDNVSRPLSLGTLARLTISVAQQALGSQARATITADLAELAHYHYYYQRSLHLFTHSPSSSASAALTTLIASPVIPSPVIPVDDSPVIIHPVIPPSVITSPVIPADDSPVIPSPVIPPSVITSPVIPADDSPVIPSPVIPPSVITSPKTFPPFNFPFHSLIKRIPCLPREWSLPIIRNKERMVSLSTCDRNTVALIT